MPAYVLSVSTVQSRIVECIDLSDAAREAKSWATGLKGSVVEVRRSDLPSAIKPALCDPAREAA